MPDTEPIEDTTHLTFNQASEYYADAFEKGRNSERVRLLKLLENPDFQDEVWENWVEDTPIYDVIIELIKSKGEKS